MEERTIKRINKTLRFEKSGETLSVEIGIENVSPNIKNDTLIPFLDTLFERAKKELNFDYSSLK